MVCSKFVVEFLCNVIDVCSFNIIWVLSKLSMYL